MELIKCLIAGSGPAGYTAAIYAARANLQPVLYEGVQTGGQLTTTTEIDNFPGYPQGVDGNQMMDDIRNQALRFGTDMRTGIITGTRLDQSPFLITFDDGSQVLARTLIIATGATAKYLGLESEEKFRGMGVSACATCDGFFYRGKDVAVVGGGDTACEEAVYLSGLCRQVYMIVRRNVLRASKAMQERVMRTANIQILWEHQTKEILGDENGVTGVRLVHSSGEMKDIPIHGFFLAIGHHPNSEPFRPWIEVNAEGYILTKGKTSHTNVEGVFAAGDVQDPRYRQAITAAAGGCMAAIDAERYLSEQL
ncbi:MAG: thioredoxin-disulfide reductase [Bacteroidales bacterium]|jgi:thioredoxin reductase (NADPH)|nr:thioredoxin-disulfide reductase [Bacteroidales bacterium]HPS25249.1 thioredoxin-disulfide reductase [Bacteroidales bacterium]